MAESVGILDISERKNLNTLVNQDEIQRAPAGYMTIFTIGDKSIAGVHSEPPFDTRHRLFLSVVPGTAAEIEELKNKAVVKL